MKKVLKYATTLLVMLTLSAMLTACGNNGEIYDGLVGRWRIYGFYGITYQFNQDGTGIRGSETFTWNVSDDTLRISRDREFVASREIRNERWTFDIAGTRLNMASQQRREITVNLDQIGDVYNALVGTWVWEGDPLWRFVFDAAGLGSRGIEGYEDEFEWGVIDGRLRIFLPMASGLVDSWDVTINDDLLRLSYAQDASRVYYYTRQ